MTEHCVFLQFVSISVPETSEELLLKKELRELAVVLKETNMVNEFANYARTERKINKITAELKQRGEVYVH